MAYKENWIVIAMITTIKLVRASIFRFHMWSICSQREMTFVCIKYFLNSALLSEETLLELLKNVTYIKKISMNSYFFFGFHIFKYFNVTLMCHLYLKSNLNRTTKLALKSYFSKSIDYWRFFRNIFLYFFLIYFLVTRNYYFCFISGR